MQTNLYSETATKNTSVEKLEECLRVELSAVETYELALKSINHVGLHHTVQEILASHARRTELLTERIGRLGGDPPTSSGIWGAFAKVAQVGADLLGDRAAIAMLEEGEDRALKLYTDGLGDCDPNTRSFVETFLPEEWHTHELCRSMKEYANAPS
jgi:bacterioferritin (cytochrome b1)